MSFSSLVKEELLQIPLGSYKENCAELYGLLTFNKKPYTLEFENKSIITRALNLLTNNFNLNIGKNQNLCCLYSKNIKFYNNILHSVENLINTSLSNNKCLPYILRGVFLSCGTVTNPNSSYHLEFSPNNKDLSEHIISLINSVKITTLKPNLAKRKSKYIVYIKDNAQIIDFLTFIGATNSSMKFIQVKMLKEVRNYINRTTNFETANITKTTNAASDQVKAIKHIIKIKGLDFLSDSLKEAANLRLNNPYMSLDELAPLFKEPITRSGVNYRLGKILEIANSL